MNDASQTCFTTAPLWQSYVLPVAFQTDARTLTYMSRDSRRYIQHHSNLLIDNELYKKNLC